MPRNLLDFGQANGGLTPPTFSWFRDAATHLNLPPPQIYPSPGGWTYYFDYSFPVAGSLNTQSVEWGVVLNGVGLTDVTVQPGGQATRFYIDFGRLNGGLAPPAFTSYRDFASGNAVTPAPTLFANSPPAWNYFFDAVWPSGTTSIAFAISLAGVNLSDVINAPAITNNAGGAMSLLDLRNAIRFESETEGDPNIQDNRLTQAVNLSRLRLYDKLITAYDSRYFTSKATFTTDGINFQFPLPDGTLYGGASQFYKGELLEALSGGFASVTYPLTLRHMNFREKNRWIRPFSPLIAPGMFPRYCLTGGDPNNPNNPSVPWQGNVTFAPLPPAGIQCRLWYAAKLNPLVNDTDIADDFGGWLEYVIVDCVLKCLNRQERESSSAFSRKQELDQQLSEALSNRHMGEPNTVSEGNESDWDSPYGLGGGMGAYGGYY